MNTERLLKLADVIEENEDHFDMDTVVMRETQPRMKVSTYDIAEIVDTSLTACGTTACMAGWTIHLWGADALASKETKWMDVAAELLGLTHDEAVNLFFQFGFDAKQAATALREMAETGTFNGGSKVLKWNRVPGAHEIVVCYEDDAAY